ncbi:glycosyltransferase family 32 protein [Blautia obeum]|uniref:glycosyltransferase family 32 protein n=1 Tax=Blautia obeum TaxID=40520 RepID=UPI003CFD529F
MIPKIIHYCWFGGNSKPMLARKCIKSWKKYCSDYDIIEWNENNFDISVCPLYVRQAYAEKKWAFVTDYVRLKVVYEYGGIYLDTDVETVKSFDSLLDEHAFFGIEYGAYIATGLGFGAEKGASILWEIMKDYNDIPFILSDGLFDVTACPVRNSNIFIKNGLKLDGSMQRICDCLILPTDYLCPYDGRSKSLQITENTISIHWYNGSWVPKEQRRSKKEYDRIAKRREKIHEILHIPNRILIKVFGKEKYQKIKSLIKNK